MYDDKHRYFVLLIYRSLIRLSQMVSAEGASQLPGAAATKLESTPTNMWTLIPKVDREIDDLILIIVMLC